MYFGKSHSESDILIFVPEEKLLMTGDLFSAWGKLHFDNKTGMDKEQWILVKQWVCGRMDKIETIIAGHGQILSKKDLEFFLTNIELYQGED
jgi:glyoxylase-like metal-dependent hydrolase (beta-lactamase superfamily II)